MQVLELRNTLGSLDATDYASCLVRSLRTDDKVWTFLTQSSGESSKRIAELAASQKLNPGTLGLLAFNQELLNSNYPDSRLEVALLEECMVSFESYLQQHNSVATLEEAAKLAIVLLEKRKIAPVWRTTLLEIVNRMHITDAKAFKSLWGSVLVVVINLVKDRDDLLSDLLKLQTSDQGIEVLSYCVLGLPISETEKAVKIVFALQDQPVAIKEKTLNYLISINEKELAQTAAKLLVGKYKIEEDSENLSKNILNNPEEALQQSMLYKQIASVAQISGETDLASNLLEKSGVILDAISTGIKVQNLSLLEQTGNKVGYFDLVHKYQLDQNYDSIMVQELASVGVIPQNVNHTDLGNQPVASLSQAKKIHAAGNQDLAKSECKKTFNDFDESSFVSAVDFQPQFNPNWNPEELVDTLVDLGAKKEAMKMAAKLLSKNPASLSAALASADTCYNSSKFVDALPLYEFASFAGENSTSMLRKLADCYSKVANTEACYKVRKQLVEIEKPEVSDMIQFAQSAISAGRAQEVFFITSKIIEQDPANSSALTINGKAYAMTGNRELAQDYFKKAIDMGTDDPAPWIGLSELQVKNGEFRQAMDTLRQGLAAMPSSHEIKRRLAEQLMDSGSASEALPLLNDLANDEQDALIGVLQLDAMKTLGSPEYDALVISLYSKFPENEEIAQAFAAQLIKNGKHNQAKTILQGKLSQAHSNAPTALTYADAVVGMDVHYSGEPKSISRQEMEKVESIVDRYLEQDSDNSRAQLVKAELLVNKGEYSKAFDYYSKLLEKQTTVDKSLWERIQAGFAQTSAFLGNFEVALAAIKQAVDSQPEWVGLRKIMANIFGMAGEVNDALAQAETVLDVAPQIVDSAIWFADFATELGKSDVAEEKLANIIELKSDDLLLRLKLAETKIKNGKTEEAIQLLEKIKSGLSVESTDAELISAAQLYDKTGDVKTTLDCLEYRYQAHPSLSSGLDLAGYEYTQAQFDKALKQLGQLDDPSNNNDIVHCLKADVLIKTDDLEQAVSLLQEDNVIPADETLAVVFIPEAWKKLISSNHPDLAILAKVLLLQGKAATCLETAKQWLADEPENADARILAIESSLALGETTADELYQPITQKETDDPSIDHLLALKINSLLDNNQAIEAQQCFEKIGKAESLSLKLISVQITLLTGHLADAEKIFDEVMAAKEEIIKSELYIKIGLNRLLVRTAAALQRWNEALIFSSEASTNTSWHLKCVIDALSTLTRAKEFEAIANLLSIETHNPSDILQQFKVEEEINWLMSLTGSKAEKEVERWMLRGKMAANPTPENIRAFALVTPTPDDAAAMVAALHATGQETTALQVAKKFPTNSQVLFELARVQSDGDETAALETLNNLIANDPLIPAAVALRSLVYERLGKLDLAINDLEQAISDWPNELKWRRKAASLWQSYGNNKNAVVQLQTAYESAPENADITLELSKALVAEEENSKAVEILLPLVKQNPNLYEAWEVLAEAQSNCGQLDEALTSAKKASQVNPFSIKPYLMSGKIHLINGNLDKALDQARTAVTHNKKDASAVLFLAKVLHEKGEKQQALAALEMTNQCDNVTVQTMVEHVNLVKEINGGAYAKELISSFSEKYPENVDLMKMLASAQEENGETAEAEQTAKRALQVEPDEPELHLFLGKISAETGQLDQAIHHLSQGIAHKTTNSEGYLMLSKVYEQQREFTKALDALKQAMEVVPNDTRSYMAAANLYRNSKNYSEAEKVLQKAVAIDPQDVAIRRQLGALLALKLVHHSQEASSQS